ncbi:MAG: hypothetical protein JRN37_09950 [Nitrososphaerota archaeon]|nr:hypothetical protein [Nitrososphaerota archaeon]MDG7039451.1 hypothetical protein [Nitrososphaerota archaeon]
MGEISVETSIDRVREFLILSTCRSFIPRQFYYDRRVFPERELDKGSIYVEAEDKATLDKIRDISFVITKEVLGIIYESKSGNTKLKWRQLKEGYGKLTGTASGNSLTNLIEAGIISRSYVEAEASKQAEGGEAGTEGKA